MFKYILSLVLISNSVLADDSIAVTKGTPVPYDGVLLSNSKANELYKKLQDTTDLNTSLYKSIDLYKIKDNYSNNEIQQLLDSNQKLSSTLNQQEQSQRTQEILWFALGVLATGLSVYAVKKISQ